MSESFGLILKIFMWHAWIWDLLVLDTIQMKTATHDDNDIFVKLILAILNDLFNTQITPTTLSREKMKQNNIAKLFCVVDVDAVGWLTKYSRFLMIII